MSYNALAKLKNIQVDSFNKYRCIRLLINAFEAEFKIYAEREQELVKLYVKHDSDGNPVIYNGQPKFKSLADEVRYVKEKAEMNEEELDFNIEPLELTGDEVSQIGLTFNDIEILEGIVNIKWKDGGADEMSGHNPS